MTSTHTFKFRRLPAAALAVMAAVALAAPAAQADTLSPTDDASVFLSGKKAQKNFGKSQTMVVNSKQSAYVRFDTSTLGSSLVEQAVLRLWVSKVKKPGDIDVYLIENDWDEDTVKGLEASGLIPTPFEVATDIAITKDNERDFLLIPVTSAVEDWLDGTDNFGLAIVARERDEEEELEEGVNKINVTFESKESVKTSHQPEIEAVPSAEGSAGSVPANAVLAFTGNCPSGFTEYTTARGRYLVGRPSGGTSQGIAGTALSNLQQRNNVGVHSHTGNVGTVGNHVHSVNPPSRSTTSGGSHRHSFADTFNQGETVGDDGTFNGPQFAGSNLLTSSTDFTSFDGTHAHTVDIPAFNSASAGSHTHSLSINSTGTSATNAPYVQLTMCRKI